LVTFGQNNGYVNTTTNLPRLTTGGSSLAFLNQGAPDMMLPAGYVLRVLDSAAIDAAADDLVVVVHYIEYEA